LPDESRCLIETTLADSGVAFTDDDYAYIRALAGHHPFLVQTAAAGLFEAEINGKTGEARYEAAGKFFHDATAAHFDDFWQYLSDSQRTAMIILALGEMQGRIDGRQFDIRDLGRLEWYGSELASLQEAGMVEQVDTRVAMVGLTLWQGTRWRVASRGFVWWAASNAIAGTRDIISFEQWLRDKEYPNQSFLTRERAKSLRDLVNSIRNSMGSSMAQIVKSLLADLTKSKFS
jgi:hypothetical protein